MNERIQKLADQAEDYADADDKFPYPSVAWLSTFKEKFAELIVKECMSIATGNGSELTAQDIAQHFGVEE